jgi:hypothetical protein
MPAIAAGDARDHQHLELDRLGVDAAVTSGGLVAAGSENAPTECGFPQDEVPDHA